MKRYKESSTVPVRTYLVCCLNVLPRPTKFFKVSAQHKVTNPKTKTNPHPTARVLIVLGGEPTRVGRSSGESHPQVTLKSFLSTIVS